MAWQHATTSNSLPVLLVVQQTALGTGSVPINKCLLGEGFTELTQAAGEVAPPAWSEIVFILFKRSKGQFYSSTFMKYYTFSEGIQIWWYIQQNPP